MRSAKTELRSGDERTGSLHPHMAACNFCRSNQDEHEEKKRGCRLFGWRISHGHTLLLPHSGCCYRTRGIVVGIVRRHLRCDREGHQKPTEQHPQQNHQGGLSSGMILCVHLFRIPRTGLLRKLVPVCNSSQRS
jgi:hypothetical protein